MCKCKEERVVKKGDKYTIVACRHELILIMEIEDENVSASI